ncbi:hypothetical protein N7468_004483 [Penicillium chermesinum]|uniref:Enoyl-CoA hydratase n=1 Tax=Penicillium chermesinum TaxID=63820 RepID=A0A9W9P8N1_9EURO|nr:uncharacterized protein N7468_004483 [Penicillium chermesinum]KAJ5239864.1 hypothetical protein N7468_004483 [Penicillium chermesinum]
MAPTFSTPPPKVTFFDLQFPSPGVLLATINRERRMNALPMGAHDEGTALWNWLDSEPSMRVGVITGKGTKAFCAGADLLEQRDSSKDVGNSQPKGTQKIAEGGFAGLTSRRGKKPVIAAGPLPFPLVLRDLVVASPQAQFALPEVLRGLYAGAGGLARVVRNCGMQIGTEIALTGRRLTTEEAVKYNLVNRVAATPESTLPEALELAKSIASMSPDAIIVSRAGLREAWETGNVLEAIRTTADRYSDALRSSENLRIGLEAFAQKKQPQWVPSKL